MDVRRKREHTSEPVIAKRGLDNVWVGFTVKRSRRRRQ
jgi:hypothetical protein